jgi:hypothetical protein
METFIGKDGEDIATEINRCRVLCVLCWEWKSWLCVTTQGGKNYGETGEDNNDTHQINSWVR